MHTHTFIGLRLKTPMRISYVCDQCPGEDEHVQNEVHALLICQDHRVCELRKHYSLLTLFPSILNY
jgi:hypothetical protein